ncbi:MAG: molecular chaperone HtpG [Alphaproteobacteria bacterium]|nr:molecular chaperone HtpG [Alphaproteobacteria bacterium]
MAKAAKKTTEPHAELHTFDAEIARVLHLMIHALYTNRDIFLRELISNASDACDKLRYQAAQNDALLKDNPDLKIHLSFDAKAKTITIEDTGIGMNREDMMAHLGTIAKSGTREFFEQIEKNKDTNLIGQFGVGFYSAFMVAEKVTVESRKAGEEDAWWWESEGAGSYTVSPAASRPRGTTITLYLKDDAKEYLDKHKLSFITKTYSDHVSFPISLTDEEGVTQTLNDGSAIWTRNKSDVTEEQYQEFYRHIAHSPEKPWMVLHNKAEGKVEYTNLLFIPGMKPFDLFHPERKRRVKLYVKRVFITDEGVDLVPAYMRFLRGVIDSSDLPLNISRETLQKNAVLTKIRESITSRVLADLKKRAEKEPEEYAKFWSNFGPVLKEGLCEATEPRDKILDACRFHSTHGDAMTSLTEYKSRMKSDQEAIYYITGDSLKALQNSPQIEGFKQRGIEVLLLTDHVDDFWTNVTLKYGETPFKSVLRAGKDFESKAEANQDSPSVQSLIDAMKKLYGEEVRDVRTTQRLADSSVCLAIGEGDMDMRMERFLAEHNQLPRRMPKILEVNPNHPLIQKLADGHDEDSLWLLLDQARIAEGEPVSDIAAFSKRLNAKLLG